MGRLLFFVFRFVSIVIVLDVEIVVTILDPEILLTCLGRGHHKEKKSGKLNLNLWNQNLNLRSVVKRSNVKRMPRKSFKKEDNSIRKKEFKVKRCVKTTSLVGSNILFCV